IQHGTVPIPKSSSKTRQQENINIFDFELTPDEMTSIDSLNRNARIVNIMQDHEHYPFGIEF
ncbi:hypothetical protein L9F63_010990, partial [Diploptera punctata]